VDNHFDNDNDHYHDQLDQFNKYDCFDDIEHFDLFDCEHNDEHNDNDDDDGSAVRIEMKHICPECKNFTEVDMNTLFASVEDARKVLGRTVSEARVHCEHCQKLIVIKIANDIEPEGCLC